MNWNRRLSVCCCLAGLAVLSVLGQTVARGEAKSPNIVVVLADDLGYGDVRCYNHSINGSFAIRQGRWKLALCPGSGGWSAPRPGRDYTTKLPPVQLFDLAADIGEQQNVQHEHPEVVQRLTSLLTHYVAEGRSTPGPAQANAVAVDIHAPPEAGR